MPMLHPDIDSSIKHWSSLFTIGTHSLPDFFPNIILNVAILDYNSYTTILHQVSIHNIYSGVYHQ